MMILDAEHYNVRVNGIVTKTAAYVANGTDLGGKKDVLGIWLVASESSRYCPSVRNGLRNLGRIEKCISITGAMANVDVKGTV